MGKEELISIIVPIYNVEDCLDKCINSIINQTYKKLEIILIDDGSTDSCKIICDNYKKLDDRIIVVHKSNGGLSSARNAGLDIAKGELIGFVDGDDYIELTMYEKMKKCMDKNNSDIVSCSVFYKKKYKKKEIKYLINNKKLECLTGKQKYIYVQNYAWNKLYKRDIFNNIRYPSGQIYEDGYIICDILEKANSISFVDEPLYNYVYRNNSITKKFNINQFDCIISINKKIDFYNKKRYLDLVIREKNRKINVLIVFLAKMKRYKIKNKEVFDKYYKELIDTNKEINWRNTTKLNKLYKLFGKPFISFLAFGLRIKDYIKNHS